jgi:hypothetical protein
MTTAKEFLKAVELYSKAKTLDPYVLLRSLSPDQLRTVLQVTAQLFKDVKDETVRRGLWEEFSTIKIKSGDAK